MCIRNLRSGPRLQTRLRSTVAAAVIVGVSMLIVVDTATTAAAQSASRDQDAVPPLRSRVDEPEHIGVGDMVQVSVFDTPELSSKLRVDADGAVEIPVAGNAVIAGLTPQSAAEVIGRRLKEAQVMTDPRVAVTIVDYATQEISVLGEVKNPGNYLLLGPHSLYNAISAAGGTSEKAGGNIVITHVADPNHPETIPVDSPDYSTLQRLTTVRAGDVVFVSRAGSVYVLGEVVRPGQFPMTGGRRLTVLEAIALEIGRAHV